MAAVPKKALNHIVDALFKQGVQSLSLDKLATSQKEYILNTLMKKNIGDVGKDVSHYEEAKKIASLTGTKLTKDQYKAIGSNILLDSYVDDYYTQWVTEGKSSFVFPSLDKKLSVVRECLLETKDTESLRKLVKLYLFRSDEELKAVSQSKSDILTMRTKFENSYSSFLEAYSLLPGLSAAKNQEVFSLAASKGEKILDVFMNTVKHDGLFSTAIDLTKKIADIYSSLDSENMCDHILSLLSPLLYEKFLPETMSFPFNNNIYREKRYAAGDAVRDNTFFRDFKERVDAIRYESAVKLFEITSLDDNSRTEVINYLESASCKADDLVKARFYALMNRPDKVAELVLANSFSDKGHPRNDYIKQAIPILKQVGQTDIASFLGSVQ
ncbi:MAG: hypothetical protein KC535_01360 [Nanoarchaeota archaeon]|nr:hypothetical protein [Nanoarchaeota archaeon]